jgi:tetratricopeptide (TPR) repeat protein
MKCTILIATAISLWSTLAWSDDCMKITDPDTSIPACTRLLKTVPASKRNIVLNNLGAALYHKGDFDRSLEVLNESLRLDPKYAFALLNRANSRVSKGDFDGATRDLDQTLKLNPKLVSAYNARGKIDMERGDTNGCLVDYNKLVSLAPKEPIAYNNRALCFRDRGEYDKALTDYDEAIRLKPRYDQPWSNRGEIFRLKGDLDRALQDQKKAIELGPKNPTNYVLRGDTYRYKGELELALSDYEKAIATDPGSTIPAHNGKGLTFEKKGDYTSAKAEFEKATTVDSVDKSDINRSALETAKARLAALNSGASQPSIAPAPSKSAGATSIPTPSAVIPSAAKKGPAQGRRIALIVGNSKYKSVPKLTNPPHDAEAIAATFRAIGFDTVTLANDATHDVFVDALRKFAVEAETADWAVVYYAGHGIEMNGINYLIPVDAVLAADRDVQFEAVPLDQVLIAVEGAKKLKLVLLDACRDNPFAPTMRRTSAPDTVAASTGGAKVGTRSIGRGLGEVKVSGATLVVFAAKNGQTALDGDGSNSPFAVAVTQRVATPGVEINKVFRLVRDDVMEATAGRQEPYTYGSLPGKEDFFFVGK